MEEDPEEVQPEPEEEDPEEIEMEEEPLEQPQLYDGTVLVDDPKPLVVAYNMKEHGNLLLYTTIYGVP
jgi:hypothetical protein